MVVKDRFITGDTKLIQLLGIKKSIDLYKQDINVYKNITELISTEYIDKDYMTDKDKMILETGTLIEIKTVIYKTIRRNII